MRPRIFVSYSHAQSDFVLDRLIPVLRAAGLEPLFDRERFELGKDVIGQMDAVQDAAAKSLLVLSPEYLKSAMCQHEQGRALAKDPEGALGHIVPVVRHKVDLPPERFHLRPAAGGGVEPRG